MANYQDLLEEAGSRHGLPAGIMTALGGKESSFNPNAVSNKGAQGLTQVMPGTAKDMGYSAEQMKQPEYQADAGARYLAQMYQRYGDWKTALQAYHDGPGNVDKMLRGEYQPGPEGRQYVDDRFSQWTNDPATNNEVTQMGTSAKTNMQEDPSNPFAQIELQSPSSNGASLQDDPNNPFAQIETQSSKSTAEQQQVKSVSPSMVDNVEQATRGLVNIPFDVLQGGAGLINAISQGLGGNKILDDVYRPVDRPTDPYAQAGEVIGGYLTPGLGMAGNMVTGSLAEAGNQQGDFAKNAATNAAINLGAQGVMSAAVNGIGKVVRGVRGAPSASQVSPASLPEDAIINAAPSQSAQAESARAAQGVTEAINPMPTEDAVRRMASQKNPNLASSLEGLDIKPQSDVVQAADRLGVNSILPSHISGNEQYQAVEQAIKSRTGSALKVQENEAIRELAAGAGKIIDDVAGAPDALGMSERFIDTVNGRMSALQRRSDQLYSTVDKAMPPSTRIEAPNTKDMLKGVADELGGAKNLDPIEKRVFQAVNPGEKDVLTYANLNKQRRLVGDALHKNSGPYKDADRAALSRLYGSLAEDQKAALSGTESLRDFEVAQRLVQMRKSMEEQMVNLRGKTLNGDVAYKATNALQAMSKGNGKGFRELMDSTPSRQLRTELIGTGLRDMLSSGKRGADFNPGGFADWYQNMMASGQMRNIAKYLPKKTMAGLNDTYKVARAIQVAKAQELQTGKLVEFVERFNRVTAPLEMAANHAQRAGTMIGSTIGGPVGAVAGSEIGQRLASRVRASGGAGSADAAEKLISSPEFQRALKISASKAPDHVVDSSIRRSPYWRRFYDSLSDSDKKTIARMGILYWLGKYDADSQ